jgi:D-tagatose-1,6-bisphosphate aldolase subunit GatZ/KbaZ
LSCRLKRIPPHLPADVCPKADKLADINAHDEGEEYLPYHWFTMKSYLQKILEAQKAGQSVGVTSVCSANQFVLEAAMRQAKCDGTPVCIESTSNQVNQFGGYAHMAPKQFVAFVKRIAKKMNLPRPRVILGGDHLGTGPWRAECAEIAMGHARNLVHAYVLAGYNKLHLDPSMPCKDDPVDRDEHLPVELVAERTASLCEAAEAAAADRSNDRTRPVYVVGTEVPTPGGLKDGKTELSVSNVTDVELTIETLQRAFKFRSLQSAWDRTIALVVETGAAFRTDTVIEYKRTNVRGLSSFIETNNHLVFEAHSTDYQTQSALTEMVEDHFAILKVGPCLTFSLREALYALSRIEEEWLTHQRGVTPSGIPQLMENLMKKNPTYWMDHYSGDKDHLRYARHYSYSDRIRYYWSHPECRDAIARLLANLTLHQPLLPLLSQYMPLQYEAVRQGRIRPNPVELIHSKIMEVTARYSAACKAGTV